MRHFFGLEKALTWNILPCRERGGKRVRVCERQRAREVYSNQKIYLTQGAACALAPAGLYSFDAFESTYILIHFLSVLYSLDAFERISLT